MKKKLVLIGGGGHAESIIDSINTMKLYKIIGIIDKKEKLETCVLGVKIIGEDKDLAYYFNKGVKNAVIAIGSIGNIELRLKLYDICKNIGYQFPNIIDKSAVLSNNIKIGEGNFIGKGTIINANVQIGNGCIINTGSIIEHDCIIEDFVHIATGSVLCGSVVIKKHTHIGAHSTILQKVTIGEGTLIGAGSLVLKEIPSYKMAFGSPVKEVKTFAQSYDNC
ncbi:acetyltransferase [[Clostridium] fimetarium]|uniref:Sugar O-acyltransferase, sialic acid O-acetyltransferase NeuD family n=1 Tax=[Clostridium] fimetarium TaxID=99656 RepID=A0A1I0Q8P2_9FIRM|nr:acetyltransferase [[Clostridium] fimetarium]SEW23343.1 sugar O-acyltransferase, sialic acid O-acetyltransferase NeuD family [[Clostridium] fimetarium]